MSTADDPATNAPAAAAGADGGAAVKPQHTKWPEASPSDDEDHVVSVVCGNTHLHWAFHNGVRDELSPALFWRTPPLIPEDLEGPLTEALSRHLPQFAHDYIFSPGGPPTTSAAKSASASRKVPTLSVYIVSTNHDQISSLTKLWSSVPTRIYLMKGEDFFSKVQGRYDTMGVDRLASLRGAASIHGYPALVFDGGTATTYTAADSRGRIMGGGITPGLAVKFRSLGDYTSALPSISPDEVLTAVENAVKGKKPMPVFSTNTREAIMVDVLSELAYKGREVIKEWLKKVGGMKKSSSGVHPGLKRNDDRNVIVTGGDGEILRQLLQPDHGGIVSAGSGWKDGSANYEVVHAKHIVHYGISAVLLDQVMKRRGINDVDVGEEADNDSFLGQRVARKFEVEDDDGDPIFRGSITGIQRPKGDANGKKSGDDWYLVKYDDGDQEHVDLKDLYSMLLLYNKHGEKARAKTKSFDKSKTNAAMAAAKAKLSEKMPPPQAKAAKGTARAPKTPSNAKAQSGKKRAAPTPKTEPKAKKVAAPPSSDGKHKAKPKSPASKERSPREYVKDRVAKDFDGAIYYGTITEYIQDSDDGKPYWHVVYDDGDEEDYDNKDLKKAVKLYAKESKNDPKPKKKKGGKKGNPQDEVV